MTIEGLRDAAWAAGCSIVDPDQDGPAKKLWNGAIGTRPALIIACRTAEETAKALLLARDAGLPVTVHAGGQDWTGRSWRDGEVVLDLSSMNSISIYREGQEATIGGGVTAAALNASAAEHGLAAVIGNDGAVGMAGLAMGGGYGPLMTRFGLVCDNLLAAEVVLVDGTIVRCDANVEPDLFWAIRGGGGNFGIVTSARVRLHDLTSVQVGTIVFAWTDARAALTAYDAVMRRAPAELFGSAVLAVGPAGRPVVVVSLVCSGETKDVQVIVDEIGAVGNPVASTVSEMPAAALLSLTDGKLAQGRGYVVGTRWLATLSEEAVDVLIAAFEERTSPLSSIVVHHCHGAATSVAAVATAFGQRDPHFTALIYAAYEPASADMTAHREWTVGLVRTLSSNALPGGYANLLPDAAVDDVAWAYGMNAGRLLELKQRYDPHGALRAIPLPGKGGSEASTLS